MDLLRFSDSELEILKILAKTPAQPLCPNCGQQPVDPRAVTGWCAKCDIRRQRDLEKKKKWWHANRGTGVRKEEM